MQLGPKVCSISVLFSCYEGAIHTVDVPASSRYDVGRQLVFKKKPQRTTFLNYKKKFHLFHSRKFELLIKVQRGPLPMVILLYEPLNLRS